MFTKFGVFSKKLLKEFMILYKNVGFLAAFYNFMWWINFYIPTPFRFRLSKWALIHKTKWLTKYIEKRYSNIISKFDNFNLEQKKITDPIIWVFWGQGESNMPVLIKGCYEQLSNNNSNVKLVTMENLAQYISIPEIVINKVLSGNISWAHFSDIIRMSLLSKFGGLWVDATVWVPSKLPFSKLMSFPIYSPNGQSKPTNRDICFWTTLESNWSGWCLWANHQNSKLFTFVKEMLIAMASREKVTVDYVLIDFLIYYASNRYLDIKRDIENFKTYPCNNRNKLASIMGEPYSEKKYRKLIGENAFFKLSFRRHWMSVTPDGKITYYGKLISPPNSN